MKKTIYQHIQTAIEKANIEGIVYEEGYPKDHIRLENDPFESEEYEEGELPDVDTITPLVKALAVVTKAIKKHATPEDDIEVVFYHLPGEEELGIAIGDGR